MCFFLGFDAIFAQCYRLWLIAILDPPPSEELMCTLIVLVYRLDNGE